MNLQIVGKVRLALTPFEPQWANVPLYLSARGFTTTPIAHAGMIFQIDVDLIERKGGDAEQVCAGFWPGDARFPQAAFFSYTYPKPDGIEQQVIEPAKAGWNSQIGEFALLYDDFRTSASPEESIRRFFES